MKKKTLCPCCSLTFVAHTLHLKNQKKPDGAACTIILDKAMVLFEVWLSKCSTKFKMDSGLLSEIVELVWV